VSVPPSEALVVKTPRRGARTQAEVEEENEFLRKDNEQLALQVRDLSNREYYLRQELLAIEDERQGIRHHPDKFHVGVYVGQRPGDLALPCEIPLPILQRSVALFGKQGAGKTNFGLIISPQLRRMGVRQLVLDRSGEWRGLFKQSEIIEAEHIRINPFSDYDGLWKDREISSFFKYTFMSFFNSTNRGATNLGRIGKALHFYMSEVKHGRSLRSFLDYLRENEERLAFPKATFDNITGYVEGFLYDDDLREVFDVQESSQQIVDLVRGNADACVQLGRFPDRIRSVVATSILRHAARRMQKEFHDKGSTQERRLSLFVTIEETADLIKGRAEQSFMEEMMRDSRKAGLGFLLFPRDDATMKELGIDNMLSSVGLVLFFDNNESISVRNPDLKKFIDGNMFGLPPGRCIMYMEGRATIVQTDRGYAIQK
jgi:hypothetical protein